MSIGIFDSGIGGLTVMKQIMRKLPHEQLIYLGDTAHLPYGDKSPETILRYSIDNSRFLMEHNIKMLVIACNTASSFAADELQRILPIPIVDVIRPSISCLNAQKRKIAVLATRATTNSGAYPLAIKERLPDAEIFSVACPLLVPLIEEHFFDHAATRLIVKEYLKPLKDKGIDALLLGCTHYPLIHHLIQQEMGPDVTIIDSASACADQVIRTLNDHQIATTLEVKPTHTFFSSDYPEKFYSYAAEFLGQPIPQVLLCSQLAENAK
jgi:glutamate racemase